MCGAGLRTGTGIPGCGYCANVRAPMSGRPTARIINGTILQRPEADPQNLRAHPRSCSDAEPDRGTAELLRPLLADGGCTGAARQCRAAGSLPLGLSDPRFFGSRAA